ncbi:FAD-binding oxidoreductase [Stenotrophobium rhamnosiphilum]|uniref:FAD-linked oxidase n=1 Tax=Stenotrophobium rhamnosiphilum TaxID=2029166 RepID=A0A2T5MHC9_9GAMM|nr:FAD-binding oxidoreductase [Stenotrophobium rhamnosiphilum]PTU31988.1 FAD-linked oxidase [Stenotrophobium rhamnosiphilum]
MNLHGWGRYPIVDAQVTQVQREASALQLLENAQSKQQVLTPRGLGRSYGDSSLGDHVIDFSLQNRLINFNQESGLLECEAGTSLRDILNVFIPKGWFLPVTPGTQFVTVGGAIASDVHGKNHHLDGSFSQYIESFRILTGTNEVLECSADQRPDLFRATCGGMGLTGLILTAKLRLRPIKSSDILCRSIRAENLEQLIALFDEHVDSPYSVAWIDCLKGGAHLGRSILMLGEHAEDGPLQVAGDAGLTIPKLFPGELLNHTTISAFNTLYYHRSPKTMAAQRMSYRPYFYPLDSLNDWNRMYGRKGFVQYQFMIPKTSGANSMRKIIEAIAASGKGSFLAVLKTFGPGNNNDLSFPGEGWTLALDFRFDDGVLELLDRLDEMVLDVGGRVYLTKDARLKAQSFRRAYPNWEKFEATRARYGAHGRFASAQSLRLGLL